MSTYVMLVASPGEVGSVGMSETAIVANCLPAASDLPSVEHQHHLPANTARTTTRHSLRGHIAVISTVVQPSTASSGVIIPLARQCSQ